jgi:hypothetical protein
MNRLLHVTASGLGCLKDPPLVPAIGKKATELTTMIALA